MQNDLDDLLKETFEQAGVAALQLAVQSQNAVLIFAVRLALSTVSAEAAVALVKQGVVAANARLEQYNAKTA